jgi:hypothetical protein
LQISKEGSFGLGSWQGIKGKLNKLTTGLVAINPVAPQAGVQVSDTSNMTSPDVKLLTMIHVDVE